MSKAAVTVEESRSTAPTRAATLGDVLYATPKAVASEGGWVDLVRATASGDQLALQALYERAHRIVFTLAMRILGSREPAEEVTIDVFHEVWRESANYRAEAGTVLAWIMKLARTGALERAALEDRKRGGTPDR